MASKPKLAMPTGSSQTQHMAIMARPKSSTHSVAAILSQRAARSPTASVSKVTAKSSRSRVMADAPMKHSHTTRYTAASSTQ
ncbi:hypothetical protein D3C72_1960900 [compost metagenome]